MEANFTRRLHCFYLHYIFFRINKKTANFPGNVLFTFRRSEKQYIVHMKKLLLFSFILEWLGKSTANWGKGLKELFLEGKKERWKNLCALD